MQHLEDRGGPREERQPFFGSGAPMFVTWFLLAMLVSLLGTNVKAYYQQRDACQAIPALHTDRPPS